VAHPFLRQHSMTWECCVLSSAERPGRCGREDLLGGRIRVVARRLGFTPEGALECREISGQNSRSTSKPMS